MALHEGSCGDRSFHRRSRVVWVAIAIVVSLVLPVCGSVLCRLFLRYADYNQVPIHTLMESLGGLMAVAIAGILIAERIRREEADHFAWIAGALIGMGVLDLYHAAVLPGNKFVWLHSCATLAGGLLFACVWLPARWLQPRFSNSLPWCVLVVTVAFGGASCWPGWSLPAMLSPDGEFTPLARSLNLSGGMGCLLAGAFFLRRFCQRGHSTDWLFAAHTTLMGTSALLFELSAVWDAAWWWWHVLRLLAYLAALSFAVRAYLDAEQAIVSLNRQLKELNCTLDRTVEARTAELQASQERFALAVRGSTDGLWDWDLRTNEVYYAPRFKELLGFRDDEFDNVLASFQTRLHVYDREPTLGAIRRHLHDGEPYDVEYRLLTKRGDYRWFRARGQAVWIDSEPVRMAGSITDVTERKRAEDSSAQYAAEIQRTNQTLRIAEGAARKALVDRDQFLAMLSHELRNPLAAMLNGMGVLEHADADARAVSEARCAIRRQVQHMSRLLDDLLDVARITQGKINFRQEVLDLNDVLVEAAQVVRSAMDSRRQELSIKRPATPVLVDGDPTRLLQVVENLLTNASKYSSPGDVISLSLIQETNECVLCVQDKGRGIDPGMLHQVFEMFFQSNSELDRSDGGMGVGLTLVRTLVELHHGSITAHSDGLGCGSRFVVRLPLTSKQPPSSTEPPPTKVAEKTRIVLVEDNPDSRDMLQAFLELKVFQ